ncbi:hypothetical protein [Agrobacterium tumefaciens]|uniref:hypothetical protein n=1 Tax=Agrobacterium tumefaciens TaxID=358 RepID=UPI001FAA273C|nr:hypothetical protein [Agrobacterium tumefaciens]UNZ49329.1 hypothetical protein MLE07_07985 [Agrobacterium tumefaciens]
MSRDSKSNRFQLMVTDAEADAIEQWAAENGLSSKAEAIRRLINIGLSASAQKDGIEEQGHRLLNLRRRAAREIAGYKARIDALPDPDKPAMQTRALKVSSDLLADISAASSDLAVRAARAVAQVTVSRRTAELQETLNALEEAEADNLEEIRARLLGIKALSEREPPR